MTSIVRPDRNPGSAFARLWPAGAVWALAWLGISLGDGLLDLANQAMVLVLGAAIAAVWLPLPASIAGCAASVLAFNYFFIAPRGTFRVDLHQHALLLVTMLAVSWIIALLMARQRRSAADERRHAQRMQQLQTLGEALRDAGDPRACAPMLAEALGNIADAGVKLRLAARPDPAAQAAGDLLIGRPAPDEADGLALCMREAQPMGPGTGRFESLDGWYLPMRGRGASFGAARLPVNASIAQSRTLRAHAQALCDQMGVAIERAHATHAAAALREEAARQTLRTTLLAAISHDYRTPLATILGAASALHDQRDRLSPEQQQRLAATISDEAEQLARLTDNTLQLARLDSLGSMPAAGGALRMDWESAEEIIGTVIRRARQRSPAARLQANIERDLPLIRCDAVLLAQLLDNLVDNAIKYSPAESPIELLARTEGDRLLLAVRDRGPGVAPEWRERIFDVFQRGSPAPASSTDAPSRRGAGVGLAVGRAIARAHGGELVLRARAQGGSSFECRLPLSPLPDAAERDADPGAA